MVLRKRCTRVKTQFMTPHHSTPTVWAFYSNRNEAENLINRISDFCEGHFWDADESVTFLQDLDAHRSSWMLVDKKHADDSKIQALAFRATEQYEFFRCLIIGSETPDKWPETAIHLDKNTLSTSIIDRLRNESHVLRIASSRVRHMRRLQNR